MSLICAAHSRRRRAGATKDTGCSAFWSDRLAAMPPITGLAAMQPITRLAATQPMTDCPSAPPRRSKAAVNTFRSFVPAWSFKNAWLNMIRCRVAVLRIFRLSSGRRTSNVRDGGGGTATTYRHLLPGAGSSASIASSLTALRPTRRLQSV